MKARPLQAIKVYVFLHELQPPCQQLIPWVTRSKPLYSLAFGKDNTHLLRCKGLFLPRAVKISSSSERIGWVPRVFRYSLIIASKIRKTRGRKDSPTLPSHRTTWPRPV